MAAIEDVDKAQGEIVNAALSKNYTCLLIADHGNAEDKSAKTMTSHTINPVPVIVVSEDKKIKEAKIIKGAGLKDVAPTILKIMGLKEPKEMTGQSFIK
jgi:2,3-bisphosphoglycerate-independent phosphoglycerate mutase